jgi:hypothetical protein
MKEGTMNLETFRYPSLRAAVLLGTVTLVLSASPSQADTLQVPWECSTYEGGAQTRCINALVEAQQKKIAELEGKLQAQEGAVNQLKSQLDRQSTTAADLQRQLVERSTTTVAPFSYTSPYSYGYPLALGALGLGLGFGLNFGNSWIYGSPYYGYSPFWGPRHYGYWGYRW